MSIKGRRSDGPRIHLVEPGGQGGVFQHAMVLAAQFARAGLRVTVHTASDAEELDASSSGDPGITICPCVDWRRGATRNRRRQVQIVWRYLVRTLPHLTTTMNRTDVCHVQGIFVAPLMYTTLLLLRARIGKVFYSPHNTFARSDSGAAAALLRWSIGISSRTFVFSAADAATIGLSRDRIVMTHLVLPAPAQPDRIREFRARWAPSSTSRIVIFAGHIRPDKRLDLAIRAAATWPPSWRLVVFGEDKGSLASAEELAAQLDVSVVWEIGWHPLPDFAAGIGAADVAVCPYDRASQSGILSVAAAVGTATVASAVGGLPELADQCFEAGDVRGLNLALERAMKMRRTTGAPEPTDVVQDYLTAYGW